MEIKRIGENKKVLIIAGTGIAVTLAAILLHKNRNTLSQVKKALETNGKTLSGSTPVKPMIEPSSFKTSSFDA